MDPVCPTGERDIRSTVDEYPSRERLAYFSIARFEYCQGKFEQFASAEVLLSNLNEVDSKMHLVSDHFEEGTEAAYSFPVCDVVAFHNLSRSLQVVIPGSEQMQAVFVLSADLAGRANSIHVG